jgi:hypothetical protein
MRTSPRAPLAAAAFATTWVVLALAACGGAKAPSGTRDTAPKGPAPDAAPPGLATTPPPAGLPPFSPMPPPGVVGSRKAKTRRDGALFACGGGKSPQAKDPAAEVKRLGEACAEASKMRPTGATFRGQQADRERHHEHRFRVEAGKCYRVYFATEPAVRDAVVVVRDSAGDLVTESPDAALPADGVMCFTAADEVTLLVAIGAGKGAYAAQVWSD